MKKFLSLLIFGLLLAVAATAQTREIYTNPKFKELAKAHQTIAVLPFKVVLSLRPAEVTKRGGAEGVQRLEEQEGLSVQSAMHSYFLKQQQDKEIGVQVQDLSKTNALLARNGMTPGKLAATTMEELAAMLGVDAVVSGSFESSQPMSDGAAVAMMLVVGVAGATNTGKLAVNINDGKTGELLWKYDKTLSRGLGSNTSTIIMTIMRKASRQMPYSKDFKG